MNFFYHHNGLTPLSPTDLVGIVNQGNPFAPYDTSDVNSEELLFGDKCQCNGSGEFEDAGLETSSFRHRFRCRKCGGEFIF